MHDNHHQFPFPTKALKNAAAAGRLDIVQLIYENRSDSDNTQEAFNIAATRGHLGIVCCYLYEAPEGLSAQNSPSHIQFSNERSAIIVSVNFGTIILNVFLKQPIRIYLSYE